MIWFLLIAQAVSAWVIWSAVKRIVALEHVVINHRLDLIRMENRKP